MAHRRGCPAACSGFDGDGHDPRRGSELQNKKATVVAAFDEGIESTTSATFVDVPSLAVTVNTTSDGMLVMRFSATAFCEDGGDGGTVCSGQAQIVVDGTPVPPGGSTIAFNEDALALGGFGVGIDRALAGLSKGSHVDAVQFRSGSAGDQFSVDHPHLTVMSFKWRVSSAHSLALREPSGLRFLEDLVFEHPLEVLP